MKLKLIVLVLVFFGLSVLAYPKSHRHHFITPSKSVCLSHGGTWEPIFGVCKTYFSIAKKMCRVSGGRVPTRHEFEKLIRSCGGRVYNTEGKGDRSVNRNSWSYQSCYEEHGIVRTRHYYWTSTKSKWNLKFRQAVDIESGVFSSDEDSFIDRNSVTCIK